MATNSKEMTPGKIIAFVVIAIILYSFFSTFDHGVPKDAYAPGAGSVAVSGTATEQALCAALDGPVYHLPALIDAVSNDAESGISLKLEGASLELHLSMTNNAAKVEGDLNDMRGTCSSQAG